MNAKKKKQARHFGM